MLTMKLNPYAWDTSAAKVKSAILSIHIKDDKGQLLNVSNLKREIELNITSKSSPVLSESSFAKPSINGSMRHHVMNISSSHMTLQIRIQPESGRSIRLFVRHKEPPTEELYDFQITLPKNTSSVKTDPYMHQVSSNITGYLGVHYIGVIPIGNSTNEHRRVRRSCFENGRQRRSADCVEFKDPPTSPPPTPKIIRPVYDPKTDVKYNMSVTMATCLYWSESKDQWTTDGCRVCGRLLINIASFLPNCFHVFIKLGSPQIIKNTTIGDLRVTFRLCFKASPSAKPLI